MSCRLSGRDLQLWQVLSGARRRARHWGRAVVGEGAGEGVTVRFLGAQISLLGAGPWSSLSRWEVTEG